MDRTIHLNPIWLIPVSIFWGCLAQPIVAEFLKTFKEFPPRAKAASFSIDQAMEKLMPKDTGIDKKPEGAETKTKKPRELSEAG